MDMGAQRNIGKFQEDLLRCCCCCEVRDSPGKNKPPVLGVALPTAVGNAILIRSTEDGARRSCVGGDGRRLGGSMGSESAAVRSLLVCAASARLGSTELPLCTAPARLSRAVQWKSIAGVLPSAAGVGWRVCRDPGDLWKLCGHLELLVSYSASSIHSSTGGSKGQSFHKNLHMRPVVSIIISYCGEREGSTGKLGDLWHKIVTFAQHNLCVKCIVALPVSGKGIGSKRNLWDSFRNAAQELPLELGQHAEPRIASKTPCKNNVQMAQEHQPPLAKNCIFGNMIEWAKTQNIKTQNQKSPIELRSSPQTADPELHYHPPTASRKRSST
ncbi:uncharacterized protein LOC132397159 isoform X2 [Hypanus sabinus]|uniref:uncharacterized protein LOC132397159 isoform X2 n=1 Tax=Hypanus sabinus TaxID=79690 RepID=UPI0028C42ABC|nr:uncharacterized protein LOC132397159 isoform X2 [Hypanus sabinus]